MVSEGKKNEQMSYTREIQCYTGVSAEAQGLLQRPKKAKPYVADCSCSGI